MGRSQNRGAPNHFFLTKKDGLRAPNEHLFLGHPHMYGVYLLVPADIYTCMNTHGYVSK